MLDKRRKPPWNFKVTKEGETKRIAGLFDGDMEEKFQSKVEVGPGLLTHELVRSLVPLRHCWHRMFCPRDAARSLHSARRLRELYRGDRAEKMATDSGYGSLAAALYVCLFRPHALPWYPWMPYFPSTSRHRFRRVFTATARRSVCDSPRGIRTIETTGWDF